MCITLPTKVLSVNGNIATVECAGIKRQVLMPFETVKSGDWVLLYAGAILSIVSEEQALETLALLKLEASKA